MEIHRDVPICGNEDGSSFLVGKIDSQVFEKAGIEFVVEDCGKVKLHQLRIYLEVLLDGKTVENGGDLVVDEGVGANVRAKDEDSSEVII